MLFFCSAGEPGNPIPNKAPLSTAFSASAFWCSLIRDNFLSMARKRRSSGSPVQQSDGPAASARCGRLETTIAIVIKIPEPGRKKLAICRPVQRTKRVKMVFQRLLLSFLILEKVNTLLILGFGECKRNSNVITKTGLKAGSH
jgi:hypothetical protein